MVSEHSRVKIPPHTSFSSSKIEKSKITMKFSSNSVIFSLVTSKHFYLKKLQRHANFAVVYQTAQK